MTPVEATRIIADVDKARIEFHKKYAGFLPDDINHKDLLIDSSYLSLDQTADFIASLVNMKFR